MNPETPWVVSQPMFADQFPSTSRWCEKDWWRAVDGPVHPAPPFADVLST